MPARRFIVSGSVQGVFFRATTKKIAEEYELTGWVRNTEDDCVEVHAEGSEQQLDQLEQWLHTGPPMADVHSVERKETDEEGCASFEIRYE